MDPIIGSLHEPPQPATHLTMTQALIGEPIAEPDSPPIRWWKALHGATLWFIWVAQNAVVFPGSDPIPPAVVKAFIWHYMK